MRWLRIVRNRTQSTSSLHQVTLMFRINLLNLSTLSILSFLLTAGCTNDYGDTPAPTDDDDVVVIDDDARSALICCREDANR